MGTTRNRLLACGTAAFMLLNALPLRTAQTVFAAEQKAAARGDLNGDGKRDSADLDLLKALIGKRPDTVIVETDDLLPYDITGDGFVDARDTYALSQFVSGAAKELPDNPGEKTEEPVTLALSSAECFSGDEVSLTLSFVDWTKDIAAYEITLGFDTALTLKDVTFLSGDCQYVPGARSVKLTGLHECDALQRGDFAVLTFTADKTLDGSFPVAVEAANVFSSAYDIYEPVKPEATVTVYPLCEPVALEVSGTGSRSVSLKWDMPFVEQPVIGYRVYRGGDMIAETADTAYTDTGLNADADYTYTVSAVTASGAETAQSMPVQVHTAGPKILSMDFPADTVSDANSDLTVRLERTVPLASLEFAFQDAAGKAVTQTADLKGADLSTAAQHWNVGALPAGTYTLRVTVTDTDGASDTAEITVNVKNSPLKPLTLKGEAGGRTAELTWSLAAEAAVTGYTVYRLKNDGKTWEKLAEIEKRDTLTYTDTKLTAGKEYTYTVTSRDSYGQESTVSNSVTVIPAADSTPPEITLFKPAGGQHVSGEIAVSIGAADNSGVSYVRCDLSADGGETWKTVGKTEGDAGSWTINTADYADGVYQLRAIAEDSEKNITDGHNKIELAFDNTAPEQIKNVRTVQVTESAAALAWDAVSDKDFSYFMVIVSNGSKTKTEKVTDTNGISLTELTPDTTYTVTVYAVDTAGNAGAASEPFRFVSINDTLPPVISSFGLSSEYASAKVPLQVKVAASDHSKVTCRYLEYSQDKKEWKRLSLKDTKQDFFISDDSLKEGKLYLRAFAEDQYGNAGDPEKAQIYELTVDNTAPPAPKTIAASDGLRSNVITWTASETEEPVTYRLERAENSASSSYSILADRYTQCKFEDTNVAPNGTYYYRVTAIDRAGNLSTPAAAAALTRTPDTEKPVVRECSLSQQNIVCSAHHTLQILAADNIRVETIAAEYRCSEKEAWKPLVTEELEANSARTELIVRAVLPEEVLQASSVHVLVTAADAAGNNAEREFAFQVDDLVAEIQNAAAVLNDNHVDVSWTCPDASGVSAFYVYRRIGAAGDESCTDKIDPKKNGTDYVCTDNRLSAGGELIYRIEAEMESGNTVSVTLDPLRISAVPEPALYYTAEQVLGAEYSYDATGSRNAADITKLMIEFGDGESAEKSSVENAVFTHTYQKTGSYQVKLTVTNKSGISVCETYAVTVSEPDVMGDVLVKVVKTDGTPAANITVYSDIGTDRQQRHRTDANGRVTIRCMAGTHEFGVFDSGYLPVRKFCAAAPDATTELRFTVQEEQLVKADFTVSRMSLAEIQAAGIAVENPENCNIVKIDISLFYQITGAVTEHVTIYYDTDTKKAKGQSVSVSGGRRGGNAYRYEVQEVSRDIETLVLMRVPAEAQFLKDFFKVDMIVLNNASAEFSLTNCIASLNLPDGLSLVEDTPASLPRTVSLGTIGGGSQSQVNWIVRGDRSGDYSISADFKAEFQPFGEHVSMRFQSAEPITVNGKEAASVQINFDPVLRKQNLFAEIIVENDTSEDMNKADSVFGNVISEAAVGAKTESRLYQIRLIDTDGAVQTVESAETIPVLHPGQKLSFVYMISNVLPTGIHGIYQDVRSTVETDANSRNVTVCVRSIKLENRGSILYGLAFDDQKDFLFLIQNKERQPVENAKFELYKIENNGKTVIAESISDEQGRVVVPRGNTAQDYCILVTPDNETEYKKYVTSRYRFTAKSGKFSDTIVLSGNYDKEDYSVTRAYFSDVSDYLNLVTQKHTVNTFDSGAFSIIGASAAPGTRYALWQEGEKEPIRETEGDLGTFAFTELTPAMFIPDRPVFILVYTEKGDAFRTELGLQIISIDCEHPENNIDIQAFSNAMDQFTKNQDWCFSIPLEWEDSDTKQKIADTVMDLTDELTAAAHSLNVNGGVQGEGSSLTGGFSAARKDGCIVVCYEAEFTKKIHFLSPEGDSASAAKGTAFLISMTASAVYDPETRKFFRFHVTVDPRIFIHSSVFPAASVPSLGTYFDLQLHGSGGPKFDGEAKISYVGDNLYVEPVDTLKQDWTASLGVTAVAGAKFTDAFKAYFYGDATVDGGGTVAADSVRNGKSTLQQIDREVLTGSLGIRADVGDIRMADITVLQNPVQLYPAEKGSTPRSPVILPADMQTETGVPVSEAIMDTALYQPYTADMIPQAGAWNAQLGDGTAELQTGISGGSEPVLVSDGTNTLIVWIVKDIARGVDNAPYAVWSRYDSSTKAWSAPKPVDDNGNGDTAPVLFAGADGIRIAYLESGKIYADGETAELNELFRNFVIKTAKFDPEANAFTDFRTADVNADGGAASAPRLAQAADGTTYLFWHSNANGDVIGDDRSNRLLCAKETAGGWDTPVVLAENLPVISSPACGQNAAGEPVCAYICTENAADGKPESALYLTALSGETAKLTAGQISAPQFAGIPGREASGLVWYQDGSLYASADLAGAEEICSSEDCCISDRFAVTGDRILFLSNISGASAMFSTQYDAESGRFTAPVCIETGDHLYYETLSLADAGGDTLYAMARTAVESSGEKNIFHTALTGGILKETADIRLAEAAFSLSALAAGEAFPVSARICNDGTVPAESLTLRILDANGREIASDTQTASIISGGEAVVNFAPVIPKLPEAAVYTIAVSAAKNDRTPENNTAKLDLTQTDIAVSAELTCIGDKTLVTVYAVNRSLVPAPAVIRVRPEQADADTLTLYTDEIAPQTAVFWQLDADDVLGDLYRDLVRFTAETEIADADAKNSTDCVLVSKSGMNPASAGDINLDGRVELEDAMLALRCYTRQVAHRSDTGLTYTQQKCADADGNGTVDVTDAMTILKYYVFCVAGKAPASFTEFLKQEQNGGANHETA